MKTEDQEELLYTFKSLAHVKPTLKYRKYLEDNSDDDKKKRKKNKKNAEKKSEVKHSRETKHTKLVMYADNVDVL